jgi:hypothetical protein
VGAGFVVIAVLPLALGILTGVLALSWAPVLYGFALGMVCPAVSFLWMAARASTDHAKTQPIFEHNKTA